MVVELPVFIEARAEQVRGQWEAVVLIDGHVAFAQRGFKARETADLAARRRAAQIRSELHAAAAQLQGRSRPAAHAPLGS